MELKDKIVVVTGAAGGIGRALAQAFAEAGAKKIVCVDLDGDGAEATAKMVDGIGRKVDVSNENDIKALIDDTEKDVGPIDLFCSNAGISVPGGPEVANDQWQKIWDINVMAHVYATRAVLPGMLARGEGYLLHTASAAGLLTNIGAAPYSVTKHAVVALAEWLAITHGADGITVSCLCPQGVRTDMLLAGADDPAGAVVLAQGAIEPEAVADAVVAGLAAERFLILPHPEVLDHFQRKAGDYDRWLGGMRKLQARIRGALG